MKLSHVLLKLLKIKNCTFFFPNVVWLCRPKTRNVQEFFFPIPTILFIVKKLYLPPFSMRLHFLNNFLNTSHVEILKIRKCNMYVNLLLYKILVYKILRFVSSYQEFAIESLKRTHCVFLVLEGLNAWGTELQILVMKKLWRYIKPYQVTILSSLFIFKFFLKSSFNIKKSHFENEWLSLFYLC